MSVLASIVVNNYNYGRFLEQAVDSALGQTYSPLEVIVVDDGSTDESRDVIASYGDRVISVLKDNGGQGSALNAGFAASRGDLVIFLDADDVLLPHATASAVERFSDPEVVKVHWPLSDIDADGRLTGGIQPQHGRLSSGDLRDDIVRQGPLAASTSPTSGNAWSRSFLERVLPMPENEFRINSDAYLVTLAWIYGRVATIDQPLALYRIHGGNNFISKPPGEKRQKQYDMYVRRCEVLALHLAKLGIAADSEPWKLNGLFKWTERLATAKNEIAGLIPTGSSFILVDEDGWGGTAGNREIVPGLRAIPFLERDDEYWGVPSTAGEAIDTVERLRGGGAAFMVFTWDTSWQLDEFPELDSYLRTRYRCALATDLIVAFDLRTGIT